MARAFELGFSVIPIEHGGKLPSVKWRAYQPARAPIEVVRKWAARPSNIGIATGAVWATSAATAHAARFAAQLAADHPDYWPETIRALMVHSAR